MLLSVLLHLLYNMYHKGGNIILALLQIVLFIKKSITMTFNESSQAFVANFTTLIHSNVSCKYTIVSRVYPNEGMEKISTTNSVDSMSSNMNDVLTSPLPSPTDFIEGTDDSSSPGSETGSNSKFYIIPGVIGACLLVIIVIVIVVALLLVCKRRDGGISDSGIATCHQPQAVMSDYETHDPIGPVAIDMSNGERSSGLTTEPVQGNIMDPYHYPTNELLAIKEQKLSISSSSQSIGSVDSPPNSTTVTQHDDETTGNTGPTVTLSSNTAIYAVIGRRTDTANVHVPPPTVERVEYAYVAGDISKSSEVNTYKVEGICDEDSKVSSDSVIKHSAVAVSNTDSPQASPFEVEQPKDDSSSRWFEYLFDGNNESTPLPVWIFPHQPHRDNNIAAATSTQDEEKIIFCYDDLAIMPLENLDNTSGVMIIPCRQLQQLEVEEEINIEVSVC